MYQIRETILEATGNSHYVLYPKLKISTDENFDYK